MTEVEKMYENADVEPKKECYYWLPISGVDILDIKQWLESEVRE